MHPPGFIRCSHAQKEVAGCLIKELRKIQVGVSPSRLHELVKVERWKETSKYLTNSRIPSY